MKTSKRHLAIALAATLAGPCGHALAVPTTWSPNGNQRGFNADNSWDTGNAPTSADVVIFASTSPINQPRLTIASGNVLGFLFDANAKAYTLTTTVPGLTMTIGTSGIVNNSSNIQTFSVPIILAASQAWNTTSTGAIIVDGATVSLSTFALTLNGNVPTSSISAVISGSGGIGIIKSGSGTWTLSGANTFTGTVSVQAGTLAVTNGAALGAGASGTTVASGATLAISNSIAINESLTIAGTGVGGFGAIRNLTGTNSIAGAVTLSGATTITSDAGSLTFSSGVNLNGFNLTLDGAGNLSYTSAISGNGGIIKTGAGTSTLSGSNSYVGTTTINGGTLVFTGINTISGGISIGTSGKLAGTGTVAGLTTVSGTISPGTTTVPVGTLTTGAENWEAGGSYLWNLTNAAPGGEGTGWDLLSINGALAVTPNSVGTFAIVITGTTPANFNGATGSYSWIIASATGGITGFAANKFTFDANGLTSSHPGTFSISSVGNNLTLNYVAPVPEPESWGAIMGASVLLIILIRRRRMA